MSAGLQEEYNAFKAGIEEVQNKILELEEEFGQHHRVLDTLDSVDDERKSMQMIGTVLVEKKVKDVKPALQETMKGLELAIGRLKAEKKEKQLKMEQWLQEHKVKVVNT